MAIDRSAAIYSFGSGSRARADLDSSKRKTL
jgi:hypothetical protein